MVITRRGLAPAGLAAGAFLVWATLAIGARADDKPIAMKISLATLDDAIHQFARNYAAAIEKDFKRAH